MHRLSASSLLAYASLCLGTGASFADVAVDVAASAHGQVAPVEEHAVADAVELDAASASDLQQSLAVWLARTFQTAGLHVRIEPQGVWGFGGGRTPSRVRAVVSSRERLGDAWRIDVSVTREGAHDKAGAKARFRAVELASVWVASAVLRKGDAIACEHLRRDMRPTGAGRSPWKGSCGDLDRLTMRRSLMPGDVLKPDDMGTAFAVRDKSETTVLTRLGRIEVRATGVALADADIGTKVPVRLNGQTQVIHAVVIGQGMARLDEGL